MKTIEQMRKDIGDWMCDDTSDSYYIGKARVLWVPGIKEFLLKLPNDEFYGTGYELVEYIDEEDILEFYPEIAEYYEEAAE